MILHYPLNSAGVEDPTIVWSQGIPNTGVNGSFPPLGVFNEPQTEIVNVITAAGITPSDADLSQLYEAIARLIANAIATVQIPNFSGTEGVKDVGNVLSFNYPGLAEEDTLNAADFLAFCAEENEGGGTAGHHYRTTMGNIASWIANYIATIPTAPVFVPVATPDAWGVFNTTAAQSTGDNVYTIANVSGANTSWGTCSGGVITITKQGLYQLNTCMAMSLTSSSNEQAYFDAAINVNGSPIAAQSSYGGAYYGINIGISLSTVAFLYVGNTVSASGLSHAGNYDPTSNYIVSANLLIGHIS